MCISWVICQNLGCWTLALLLFAASLLVLLLAPSEFLLICELLLFLALNIVCCQCFCLLDACSKTSSNQTYCLLIAYRTCCTYVCCLKERLRTHIHTTTCFVWLLHYQQPSVSCFGHMMVIMLFLQSKWIGQEMAWQTVGVRA